MLMPFWTSLIPPMGIACLKSFLQDHGFRVRAVNANEDLELRVTSDYPDAWASYFETTLLKQGFENVGPAGTPTLDGDFNVVLTGSDCTVTFANVDKFESTVAAVDIWFG